MPITVTCSCGERFSVPDSLAGKSGRCKAGGRPLTIPPEAPARADGRSVLEADLDMAALVAEAASEPEAPASLLLADPDDPGAPAADEAEGDPPALGEGVWDQVAREDDPTPLPPPPPTPTATAPPPFPGDLIRRMKYPDSGEVWNEPWYYGMLAGVAHVAMWGGLLLSLVVLILGLNSAESAARPDGALSK